MRWTADMFRRRAGGPPTPTLRPLPIIPLQAGRISAWRITREVLYPDVIAKVGGVANDAQRRLVECHLDDHVVDFGWQAGFLGAYDRDGTFRRPRFP
jgi:hypothetical protein